MGSVSVQVIQRSLPGRDTYGIERSFVIPVSQIDTVLELFLRRRVAATAKVSIRRTAAPRIDILSNTYPVFIEDAEMKAAIASIKTRWLSVKARFKPLGSLKFTGSFFV